jgi:hypothetical protein
VLLLLLLLAHPAGPQQSQTGLTLLHVLLLLLPNHTPLPE